MESCIVIWCNKFANKETNKQFWAVLREITSWQQRLGPGRGRAAGVGEGGPLSMLWPDTSCLTLLVFLTSGVSWRILLACSIVQGVQECCVLSRIHSLSVEMKRSEKYTAYSIVCEVKLVL